ncbi:MAG: hypothetical protein R3B70_06025 [Polyangiaceae bacterium]
MTRRLDFFTRCFALAGALLASGLGCAQQVSIEPTAGGGGEGGAGGAGGATTTTTTPTTSGACQTADDCIDLSGTCVVGTCINGECTTQPGNQFGACDDGLFCTTGDSCQDGLCVGGPPLVCPGGDACQVGVCDELTDTCTQQAGNNGAPCEDNDPCSLSGVCINGMCTQGKPVDCTFLNTDCTVGVCDPAAGGCTAIPVNDGFACDDGLFCTINDSCQAGTCVGGAPMPCAPPGGCFVGFCDEATDKCTSMPGNNGAACDDGSPCTAATTCTNGVCGGGTPANDGAACDDGTSCTSGETCNAGLCAGGVGPTIYFADDFKDNSKGWTLGPEWEIGPAKASVPGVGNPDPAMDHTPTADNGIAGVVIGGNASTNLHDYYYLESPAFDTSGAAGSVILGFYRWLNSDYDPFMHNRIEVYNGNQWITLFTSGGPPGIMDNAWTYVEFDLTAYKNASMRVRFGFDITSGGVFTIGSWNIDDVLVASAGCP